VQAGDTPGEYGGRGRKVPGAGPAPSSRAPISYVPGWDPSVHGVYHVPTYETDGVVPGGEAAHQGLGHRGDPSDG